MVRVFSDVGCSQSQSQSYFSSSLPAFWHQQTSWTQEWTASPKIKEQKFKVLDWYLARRLISMHILIPSSKYLDSLIDWFGNLYLKYLAQNVSFFYPLQIDEMAMIHTVAVASYAYNWTLTIFIAIAFGFFWFNFYREYKKFTALEKANSDPV